MIIQKLDRPSDSRIFALVYGQSGAGKTTLAKTLPGKTLIISAESGLLSIEGSGIDFVDITKDDKGNQLISGTQKYTNLRKIYSDLNAGVEYDNIFIDSLSEIGNIIVEMFQDTFKERKDALVMWGEISKTFRAFVKAYRDMTRYSIIMTALEKDDKDDMSKKSYIPELPGRASAQAIAFFDEIFNYVSLRTEDGQKRFLITDPYEGRLAKDRSGKLDKFEKPDLNLIFNKIRGV